ncbi:MAG: stage II sporulation protein R [Bacillus sp. (in: Bacteria)]|nr:stage II sporulation protein R [Bacillus sp. (in: firmicutes)]
MKNKLVVWGYLIVLSVGTILSLYIPKSEAVAQESIVIPGEAIRLRILANSDLEKDQLIKRKVRDAVNAQITLWVQDLTSMEKAKTVITENIPEIQAIAEKVVREQGDDQSVKVEFGNVQFPTKLYGQFLYPAGEYQAILITLGSGDGANWWCVLYPPLCFLDFSNGVAVSAGFDGGEEVAVAETESETVSEGEFVVAKPEVETVSEGEVVGGKPEVEAVSEEEVVDSKPEPETETASEEEVLVDNTINSDSVSKKHAKKASSVYTAEDEQPVKVKFFVVELWERIFK